MERGRMVWEEEAGGQRRGNKAGGHHPAIWTSMRSYRIGSITSTPSAEASTTHLYILQRQVLCSRAAVHTEDWPPPGHTLHSGGEEGEEFRVGGSCSSDSATRARPPKPSLLNPEPCTLHPTWKRVSSDSTTASTLSSR